MATSLDCVPGDFCVRRSTASGAGGNAEYTNQCACNTIRPPALEEKQEIEDMRYIDAFNHFFPKRIYELMLQSPAGQKDLGRRMQGISALYDIEERLRVVDSFADYTQVICLGMPAIDRLTGPDHSPEWAQIGNDRLAELVAKCPDRFAGYAATLPMNPPAAAAKEAERVLSNGANAIQLHTNADGAPIDQEQFLPIYEIIERSGKPILLHPIRTREMADYRTETVSKYEICSVIGWPFETGAALARLVFSGIMDRFPNLKVIAHHLGGIIPYFEGRVAHSWDQLGARTSDEDYSLLLKKLKSGRLARLSTSDQVLRWWPLPADLSGEAFGKPYRRFCWCGAVS